MAEGDVAQVAQLLQNFSPSEVLVAKPQKQQFISDFGRQWPVFYLEDWVFAPDFAHQNYSAF